LSGVSGYTVRKVEEVPDVFGGKYPGAMRMFTDHIGAEQVAFTHRVMPPKTGGKGSYGHRHKTQEEIYFVISGALQFKLDDEVIDVGDGTVVRVAPETVRSVWNDGPDDAELVICSVRIDDRTGEADMVENFWPAE
jgi:mannose-6-phosphate isomerase-like protein (cupin superfamily)